jgi:hypothetical protein
MDAHELGGIARSIVDWNRDMTLRTADEDGLPWVSPVWHAAAGYREFFWVSKPEARHSRNLSARPELVIVIFDSYQPGGWHALHDSRLREVTGADIDDGIAVFTRRSDAQGPTPVARDDVRSPARHRLYRPRRRRFSSPMPTTGRSRVTLE